MGRQINFYMAPNDEKALLDYMLSKENIAIIGQPSPTNQPRILKDFNLTVSDETLWLTVYLWNRDTTQQVFMKAVKAQGYYLVDFFKSEVVQWGRCYLDMEKKILRRGRLWLEAYHFEGDQPIKKNEAFIRWFERLQRWVRKNYTKSEEDPGCYVGREALLLKDYGVKFTSL
ncbi:MAG: hypothetical protein O7E52_05270 [Candidatus Poribacteria bacterium]|nr:hypothetical protein [Candidatus Poribacteria bacterium]